MLLSSRKIAPPAYSEYSLKKMEPSEQSIETFLIGYVERLIDTDFIELTIQQAYKQIQSTYGVKAATKLLCLMTTKLNSFDFSLLQHIVDIEFDSPDLNLIKQIVTYTEIKQSKNINCVILENFYRYNARSCQLGFTQFITWLLELEIPLSDLEHKLLLSKIPHEFKQIRSDIPPLKAGMTAPERTERGAWGMCSVPSLERILYLTSWGKHNVILRLFANAPVEFLEQVLTTWLLDGNCEAIRNNFFTQTQHPLSLLSFEHLPWNLMLFLIDRIYQTPTSSLRSDLELIKCQIEPVQCSRGNETLLTLSQHRLSTIFGRTLAYHHTSTDKKNLYLKFQLITESDETFLNEAKKLHYFYENSARLCLKGIVVKPESIFKIDNLSEFLSQLNLTEEVKILLSLKCVDRKQLIEHFSSQLLSSEESTILFKLETLLSITNQDELLANLRTFSKKKLLLNVVSMSKCSCHVILMSTASNEFYEQYVYDAENSSEFMLGVETYLEEVGTLFHQGLIAPDACSSFHSIESNRQYAFLAPYADHHNMGCIDQLTGTSTDYPNIGPKGMRDRGDYRSKTKYNLDYVKLAYKELGLTDNKLKKICVINDVRDRLSSLASSVWGCLLLYGRYHQDDLDYHSSTVVCRVEADIETMLITLFNHAFALEKIKCLELLKQYGLIHQIAMEVCYWMSNDFVEDLHKGVIPKLVYKGYSNKTEGLHLFDQVKYSLGTYGYKGTTKRNAALGVLGSRNPIIALDKAVVLLLSHGVLKQLQTRQRETQKWYRYRL